MHQPIPRHLLLILLACILLVVTHGSAQASTQTDWPMFGFDTSHSHYNPFENTLSTSNVGTLALQWQAAINGPNNYSSPVVGL